MNIISAGYLLLQITISYADYTGIVSEERLDAGKDRRQDTVDFDVHKSNRRFNDGDDVKDNANFENIDEKQNQECRLESFDETVDKYKKPHVKEPRFIEFVSSDALTVKEEDILAPCTNVSNTKNVKAVKERHNVTNMIAKKDFTPKTEIKSNTTAENHEALTPNTATTANVKRVLSPDDKDKNAKAEKIRRSEYQFSSVEYYDLTNDFDSTKCPDALEVIILQQDEVRKYDVECEAMIEWRSLE